MKSRQGTFLFYVTLPLIMLASSSPAQEMEDAGATTELSCSFAMDKGETARPCQVPFPEGCRVATIPGTTHPWTTISKGGQLQCRFDEKETNWKTKITGVCGKCQSVHCSVKFSVRFVCTSQ